MTPRAAAAISADDLSRLLNLQVVAPKDESTIPLAAPGLLHVDNHEAKRELMTRLSL